MRVHRLINILMKIDQQGKVKAQDMAAALEVSSRTIYRDIDVLCEAGYPIITTTGKSGGIYFAEGYELNMERTEDILKTLMTHLYTLPDQERLASALESGMNVKYSGMDNRSSSNVQKILIDKKSWWGEDVTEIDIQPVMKALFLQQKLHMQYMQKDGSQTERTVAPYGLVLKYATWYLIAFCCTRQEVRTFQCARIKKICMLRESYSIPADFNLEKYWSSSSDAFRKSRRETEYYPVEIKVHKSFGTIFQNYDVTGIRNDGEYIIGTVNLHRKDFAEADIRSFLGYGQILYPEEMKNKAKKILEEMHRMYDLSN